MGTTHVSAPQWHARHHQQHGQTLVIVALLLPVLVLILAMVVDLVSITTARQRLEGEAQLAADAGATEGAKDVFLLLVLRHGCQPNYSFGSWDTPPCAIQPPQIPPDLERDCPKVSTSEFMSTTDSDSQILAGCLDLRFYDGWYRFAYGNLGQNQASYDTGTIRFSCTGSCYDRSLRRADCSSISILCVEVLLTKRISLPLIGPLIGARGDLTLTADAFASIALPQTCIKVAVLSFNDACSGSA